MTKQVKLLSAILAALLFISLTGCGNGILSENGKTEEQLGETAHNSEEQNMPQEETGSPDSASQNDYPETNEATAILSDADYASIYKDAYDNLSGLEQMTDDYVVVKLFDIDNDGVKELLVSDKTWQNPPIFVLDYVDGKVVSCESFDAYPLHNYYYAAPFMNHSGAFYVDKGTNEIYYVCDIAEGDISRTDVSIIKISSINGVATFTLEKEVYRHQFDDSEEYDYFEYMNKLQDAENQIREMLSPTGYEVFQESSDSYDESFVSFESLLP